MNKTQIFLSLTASFISAFGTSNASKNVIRAIEESMHFGGLGVFEEITPEQAAFEYAQWIVVGGRAPEWLPKSFRHGYV